MLKVCSRTEVPIEILTEKVFEVIGIKVWVEILEEGYP
jgi:hypothetical protein